MTLHHPNTPITAHSEAPEVLHTYFPDGTLHARQHWLDGALHNAAGPATEIYHPNGQKAFEEHSLNGQIHNQDAAAIRAWDLDGQMTTEEFWQHGVRRAPLSHQANKSS